MLKEMSHTISSDRWYTAVAVLRHECECYKLTVTVPLVLPTKPENCVFSLQIFIVNKKNGEPC
jgi:hypothetical protein